MNHELPCALRASRTGLSDPAGKMVERLDVPCTQEMFAAVTTMATLRGMPRSEWVREVLQRELYGSLGMAQSLVAGRTPRRWEQSPDETAQGVPR